MKALERILFLKPRATLSAYVVAGLIVTGATLIGFAWTAAVGPRNLGQVYIAAILLVAVTLGTRPALLAALLSFLAFNFFLVDPRLSWKFLAADWLALTNFIITALIVSGLAGRLRDRERDATERLRDLTALFDASRALSSTADRDEAIRETGVRLEREMRTVGIWTAADGRLSLGYVSDGAQATAEGLASAVQSFYAGGAPEGVRGRAVLMRLQTQERALGVVALWDDAPSALEKDKSWIRALLELGAVAIDRARLIGEVANTKVIAEREGLRTALLSSLSHDLRTPISAILASVTGLQEHEGHFDETTKRALLDAIQDETERLNRYVGNLLEMTKLESGALKVRLDIIDPAEAVASALAHAQRRLGNRRVVRSFATGHTRIEVDPVLLEQALSNVIENAISYSPDETTLYASTALRDDAVILSIEDTGPGIATRDLPAIFDKFYRGRSDRGGGAGVGLGLSVTRGLLEAFGGVVSATSPAREGRGTRIDIRLPAQPALEPVE